MVDAVSLASPAERVATWIGYLLFGSLTLFAILGGLVNSWGRGEVLGPEVPGSPSCRFAPCTWSAGDRAEELRSLEAWRGDRVQAR